MPKEKFRFETTADIKIPKNPLDRVIGQDEAVKFARIAAVQRRNLLLVGPPGTGKSMIGQAISYLLPKPKYEISVIHNPEKPERPIVQVRTREEIEMSKNIEKEIGKIVYPEEVPSFVAERLGFRCRRCGMISSPDVAVCPHCGADKFRAKPTPFDDMIAVQSYRRQDRVPALWRSKTGEEKTVIFERYGMKIRMLDDKDLKMLEALELQKKRKVIVPLERSTFVQATGASETELLGDVRHDPYGSHPEIGVPPYKRVVAGAIHEAHEGVLFIDEIHTLVGAGKTDGAMDASNMLKPALARGELHCIGATTIDEYRKYIEKDAALERRFQPILVEEPSVEDTIAILRGLKEKYEVHHGVRIKDSAIVAAATLSHRYITDRFLPDKAIDLIDESAAKLRIEIDSLPAEIDEIQRRMMKLEIEREALKKESDEASRERLKKIEQELADLREQRDSLKAVWEREKEQIHRIRDIKEKIDSLKVQAEQLQRQGELNRVAEILYGEIPRLEQELEDAQKKLEEQEEEGTSMLKEEVDAEDIAAIIAKWTGIPVSKLLQGEREKLIHMEEQLAKRVVGQEEAIVAVSNAVRRARAGLQAPTRPIGSFIFLGPTGVGKTELSRALAEFMFDTEQAMIRIDMSEFMEKHAVARLIGAPPGYVGYEEGGYLTEAVRRKPYSVILFDEIEKAHPDVFNILLQILDDGRLTDGKGRTVDFKNTIIIMTSNIGSDVIMQVTDHQEMERRVLDAMRLHFKPEFLNRVDDIIIFHALTREHLIKIVDIQLRYLGDRLEDAGYGMEVTDKAKQWIADRGFDPAYGARPIKRAIQRYIEDPLALRILEGAFVEGDTIRIDVDENGNAVFEKA